MTGAGTVETRFDWGEWSGGDGLLPRQFLCEGKRADQIRAVLAEAGGAARILTRLGEEVCRRASRPSDRAGRLEPTARPGAPASTASRPAA